MSAVLDIKFESILSWERSVAKAVALAMSKARPISVWEVTIPLIFIYNYMKIKRTREIFVQNSLFTKELALQAAFDMIKKNQPRDTVISRIKDKTSSILASEQEGVYSEKIRQRQMKEIDLLIDHYCKLLNAEGQDYNSLVTNAYQSQKNYTTFLGKLKEAERQVMHAARQTLGAQASPKVISKIEAATDRVRRSEAERIFRTVNC